MWRARAGGAPRGQDGCMRVRGMCGRSAPRIARCRVCASAGLRVSHLPMGGPAPVATAASLPPPPPPSRPRARGGQRLDPAGASRERRDRFGKPPAVDGCGVTGQWRWRRQRSVGATEVGATEAGRSETAAGESGRRGGIAAGPRGGWHAATTAWVDARAECGCGWLVIGASLCTAPLRLHPLTAGCPSTPAVPRSTARRKH